MIDFAKFVIAAETVLGLNLFTAPLNAPAILPRPSIPPLAPPAAIIPAATFPNAFPSQLAEKASPTSSGMYNNTEG